MAETVVASVAVVETKRDCSAERAEAETTTAEAFVVVVVVVVVVG